jgi:hypothetical protein
VSVLLREVLLAACLGAVACGCGVSGPALAPLTGTVSLDGEPLKHGLVQFVPESGAGPAAVGNIVGGRFVAETAGRRGAMPGRYRVRIESRAMPADETDTLPKSLVAERYGNAATSGIVYDVTLDRDNVFDIAL